MIKIFQIVCVIISLTAYAQKESIESGKYAGAKYFFEEKYEIQKYHKFSSSQIKIEENKVILGGLKSIEFSGVEKKYRIIFENGFLDPYDISRMTNLKICCLEELPLLNPNPQTKRFKFWIFPKNNTNPITTEFQKKLSSRVNPDEYYFELKNQNATEFTSFEDFVKDSELTCIAYGGIIL